MEKNYKITKASSLLLVFMLSLIFSPLGKAQKADNGFVKQQDLTFFKGDSLNGFPLENEFTKCKQLEQKLGALYEYKYILKQKEAKFVKQKYHIDKLPYEIAEEKLRQQNTKQVITQQNQQVYRQNNPPQSLASSCNNIDFEDGNFTNWIGYEGYNEGTNNPLTTVVGPLGPPPTNLNSTEPTCNYFSIISNGSTDPNMGIVLTSPLGGDCARMGGENRNLGDANTTCAGNGGGNFTYTVPTTCEATYFGANIGDQLLLAGSAGEVLQTTFNVTPLNSAFQYAYLFAYADNGDHDTTQQPYFKVRVLDHTGQEISCLNYFQQGLGDACGNSHAPPGYSGSVATGFFYTSSWQVSSLNLLPYMGQAVTVIFTVAGCTVGGHFGYAYVDCACAPQEIIIPFTACQGGNTSLIAPPLGNALYQWTTPNGNIVSGGTNDTVIVNQSGTYSVTITPTKSSINGAGALVTETLTACSYKLDTTITLYPNPTVSVNSMSVCSGGTATLTAASTGSAGTLNYTWNLAAGFGYTNAGDSSGTIVPASTSSYTVTGTSVHNCTNTAVATVTVNPSPPATFTAPTVCIGSITNFTNTTAGASTYNWAFGDGVGTSTLENPSYQYTAAGNFPVSLTVTTASGCISNGTQTVSVISNPTASFSAPAVCLGNATVFTSTITNGNTYSWTFGDGNTNTTSATPSNTYATSGTFPVSLTVTAAGGCKVTVTNSIVVNQLPTAAFTVDTVCLGTASVFTNTSTLDAHCAWNFGGAGNWVPASPACAPEFIYTNSGTFVVTLTVTSAAGCKATATGNALVNPFPTLGFTATHPCEGIGVNFTNTTANQASISAWDWNFGDGSADATTATILAYTYSAAGCYVTVLSATASTGCSGSFSATVNVHANPFAYFNAFEVCKGSASEFVDSSFIQNPDCLNDQITSWQYAFGDGGTAAYTSTTLPDTIKHTYASCGAYNITLTVTTTNGCTNSNTLTGDTVFCIPTVSVPPSFSICPGMATATQTFTSTVTNGGPAYTVWYTHYPITNTGMTIADTLGLDVFPSYTTLSPNPSCTPVSDWLYAIAASNYCIGTPDSLKISVYPTPTVTPTSNISVCANQPVNVPAFTGCPTPETFTWSTTGTIGIAATGTANIPVFTATNSTNATVVTTVSVTPMANGCIGTPSDFSITVNPIPTISVSSITVCPSTTVTVITIPATTITTNINAPGVVTYSWTATNHTNIGLAASGTGSTSLITPTAYPAPTNTTLTNQIGYVTYTPTYNTCVGLPYTDTINIKPTPIVTPITPPAYCPNQLTAAINFTCTPSGGTPLFSWQGLGGIGGSSIGDIPPYVTANNTSANVVATVSVNATLNGCQGPNSMFNITVYPNPVASFIAAPVCQGNPTSFTSTSYGNGGFTISNWEWDMNNMGNYITGLGSTPQYTLNTTDSDAVGLLVFSNSVPSCTASVIDTVVVNPNPVANFTGINLTGCPNINPTFTNASTISSGSITNWTWSFSGNVGQPVTQHGQGPLSEIYTNLSNTTPAYYTVILTATSAAGCSNTFTTSPHYIKVYPTPVANFSWGPTDANINNPVITFVNQAQGYAPYSGSTNPPVYEYGPNGVQYSLYDPYAANNSLVDNATSFTHAYNNIDQADVQETYPVTQWVVNSYGCTDSITIPVIIQPIFTFYIPNAFTPNGDGKNEGFKGIGEGIDNNTYNMWIFDRWGLMIYYTSDMNQVWDGHMHGDEGKPVLLEDVYVWKVKFSDIFGMQHEYHGTVTLIK